MKSKYIDIFYVFLFPLIMINKYFLKISVLNYIEIVLFFVFLVLIIWYKFFNLKHKIFILALSILNLELIYRELR